MKTAVPGTRTGGVVGDRAHEVLERVGARRQALGDQPPAGLPGRHQREADGGDDERQPAALDDLEQVGAEEREVDDQEDGGDADGRRQRPAPSARVITTSSSSAVITIVIVTATP